MNSGQLQSNNITPNFTVGATGTVFGPTFIVTPGLDTLIIPMASTSGVSAGLISNADYVSFAAGGSVLGGKYVRTTRFASVGSGTTGTITLPSNSQVVLDDFGGTVDAVVAQISGGKPTLAPALTSGGVVVATSFDSSGNYVFTAAPSAYPVALVYRVQQTLTNFDSTSSDIWGEVDVQKTQTVVGVTLGGTGTSTVFTQGSVVFADGGGVYAQDNANLFWDDTNNKLGIGTVSPGKLLTISATDTGTTFSVARSPMLRINNTSAATGTFTGIQFGVVDPSNDSIVQTAIYSKLTSNSSNGQSDLLFGTHAAVSDTDLTEKMRLTAAGRLGIGTASPQAKLDINSSAITPFMINSDNFYYCQLTGNEASSQIGFGIIPKDSGATNLPGGYFYVTGSSPPEMSFLAPGTNTGILNFGSNDGSGGINKYMVIKGSSGFVGIGTTSPGSQLHTTGSVRFANFGAGAATFDASGNISSVSDERLKDIKSKFTNGLDVLSDIEPIIYKWNKESGMEMEHEYVGFSAQNIKKAFPGASGCKVIYEKTKSTQLSIDGKSEVEIEIDSDIEKDRYYSIQDRALMAAMINAIKELNDRLKKLEG